MLKQKFNLTAYVSDAVQSPTFQRVKALTDFSDSESTRELFRYFADGLSAFARYTPTKVDDQIAAILQFGIDSDLVWTAFWKILQNLPGLNSDAVTTEMCRDYTSVAYACDTADTSGYVGAGFLDLVTFVQFVKFAVQIFKALKNDE